MGKANLVQEGKCHQHHHLWHGRSLGQSCHTRIGISADILDLRTLLPWDKEAVEKTVRKTGKVIFLQEDCLTGGIGAEICAWISENCFEYLDAPVMREGSLDTPVPFAPNLERIFFLWRGLRRN
jgi:2-oxoisovalerate dehydrogenase E1 component